MTVHIYENVTTQFAKSVVTKTSPTSQVISKPSFITVPLRTVTRNENGSPLFNNWREPNPFDANYFELIPHDLARTHHGYGFNISCSKSNSRYPNDPRFNYATREGLWSAYPTAINKHLLAGRFRDRKEMESLAIAQSYNALKESPMHLGMFLGTLGETFEFIADTYLTFSKALRLLRQGKVIASAKLLIKGCKRFRPKDINILTKKARALTDVNKKDVNFLDVISGKWLELQFAWGPLLDDIHGLITMAPHVTSALQMPRVTGRRVLSRSFETDPTITREINPTFGPNLEHSVSSSSKTTVICRTDWTVGNPTLYMLSMLGLVNPVEVAWDKVPFSFVVDWFIPVGTWISAFTAETGLEYLGGSITTTSDTLISVHSSSITYTSGDYTYSTTGDGGFTIADKVCNRVAYPYNAPSLRIPPITYPKSLWHAITGGALLLQTKDLITRGFKSR